MGQLLVVVWDYLSHVSTTRTDPWSDGSAKLELAIYYGEPNRISRLKISGGVTSDLGSELVLGRLDIFGLDHRLQRDYTAVSLQVATGKRSPTSH